MSTTFSRIFIDFEECLVVKSVFLVDHAQMPTVGDVIQAISHRHHLNVLCKNENLNFVSLWLNNYRIPSDEQSQVLSHNDAIVVRIQRKKHQDNSQVTVTEESTQLKTKKRKLKRKQETEPSDSHSDNNEERLQKAKDKLLSEVNKSFNNNYTGTNVDTTQVTSHNAVANTEISEPVVPENSRNEDFEVREADLSDTGSTKKKRKRVRKRRKRTPASADVYQNISQILQPSLQPENSSVIPDPSAERCFGSYPGQLQKPKQFRQGFRKAVVCRPEPIEHIRFGDHSDEEDVTQNVNQYKFLAHSVLEEKKVKGCSNISEEHMNWESDKMLKQLHQQRSENMNGVQIKCESAEEDPNCQTTSTGLNSNGNASEDNSSSLGKKVLPNGVTVFTRNRRGQINRNLPVAPGMGQNKSFEPYSSTSGKDFISPPLVQPSPVNLERMEVSSNGVASMAPESIVKQPSELPQKPDYSKCAALLVAPKPGDRIAYKVLEMSVNCCPEVSDYREAEVLSVDKSQMIQLKHNQPKEVKFNKFHLEVEDENAVWTNVEEMPDIVTLHISSLLEPKIL